MFAINVVITVKNPADIPRVGELLRQAGKLSRLEPGCLMYEANHSNTDPNIYFLIERWADKPAWELHRTAEAYLTIYHPQVLPLVDRVGHFCDVLE